MVYIPAQDSDDGIAKVVYTSKDRKVQKVFTAPDWLARLVTHIPVRYEQAVRYYGHYSNKSRGLRKKAGTDDTIPTGIPNEMLMIPHTFFPKSVFLSLCQEYQGFQRFG